MAFRVTGSLDMAVARDTGLAIARPVVSPFSSGKSHINRRFFRRSYRQTLGLRHDHA